MRGFRDPVEHGGPWLRTGALFLILLLAQAAFADDEDDPRLPLRDIDFTDGNGAPRSLADFRGRLILVNVWATWCAPCRQEMPALDRLQARLGGPKFEVVAISIDKEGAAVVRPFFRELGLKSLRIYLDTSGEAMAGLGGVAIPITLLVDSGRREMWRVSGPVDWDKHEVVERLRRDIARHSR